MNKELEALEDLHVYALGSYELEEDCYDNEKHYNFVEEEYKIIKSALEQKEKLEKFCNIIENKPQQYAIIKTYHITRYLRADLSSLSYEYGEELLTIEEFEFLKEFFHYE